MSQIIIEGEPWSSIMTDPELAGARRKLSLHEIRTIARHASGAARKVALEDAAKICEKRAAERFDEFGITEPDTNASYYSGRHEEMLNSLDEEDDACATAIRALATK